ncbi:hypothetical protein C8Q70DRAFT_944019 [Cubamyces menziesii]|nr:hypothetical protein C8Q70DRAFT_944019 [Cubamyces menziesii]
MEVDSQLSQLLNSLSLDSQRRKVIFGSEEPQVASPTYPTRNIADAAMSDSSDSEDSTYQVCPSFILQTKSRAKHPNPTAVSPHLHQPSRSASQPTSSSSTDAPPPPPPCGCAYLQALQGQIRAGSYATTGGDYLEAIFTHREAFFAFPPGHRGCALGFSELARDLEARDQAWRADWDGDSEAAAAFRHEAWVIANAF